MNPNGNPKQGQKIVPRVAPRGTEGRSMEGYTEYGYLWADGIERASDSTDERDDPEV